MEAKPQSRMLKARERLAAMGAAVRRWLTIASELSAVVAAVVALLLLLNR